MAQQAPCYLPSFGTTTPNPPKRPVLLRINTSPLQNTKLLSAFKHKHIYSLLKTAWALLLRQYTGLENICFGYQNIGVDVSLPHALSQLHKLSICALTISENDTIQKILKKVAQKAYPENDPAAGTSFIAENNDNYSLFNTILMIRACCDPTTGQEGTLVRPVLPINLPHECRARLHVKVLGEEVCIFLEWWNHDLPSTHMKSVASYFEHILDQTLSEKDIAVTDLHFFSEHDQARISKFNSILPETCERCIHEVIQEQSVLYPEREAICAWDGSLTYRELDHLASKLARHLQYKGVGPEIRVALCFDKSKWNSVAMLGVLKAGGAFVPLDPAHPSSRLKSLMESVDIKLMLCSRNHADAMSAAVEIVIPLDDRELNEMPLPADGACQAQVKCDNAAYLIFTSGSTGQPKGTLLEHRAFLSGAIAHAPVMGIDFDCRMLQFASHTFDASLIELLTPLFHGGCVCIPSEEDRLNNVIDVINSMKVNVACLTPSFVKFIDPSKVKRLKRLTLAGEAMSRRDLETWSDLTLVNGYGPTEASVAAVMNQNMLASSDCRDIGFPVGVRCWVVNPKNHDQLVPIGSQGELLLEGPTLARCYVNNVQKTEEAFIYNPAWAENNAQNNNRRFYKTGDLVRYNCEAGALTFIGRKDTQIKFHGQRIELGEIENHLGTVPKIKHSLVFLSGSGFSQGKLVAVLALHEGSCSELSLLKLLGNSKKSSIVTEIRHQLSNQLPAYMIPAIWLCVEALPFLPSGKLDRRAIMSWATSLNDRDYQIETFQPAKNIKGTHSDNSIEDRLLSIWSRVLNIPKCQIGLDDGFLSLGGDSIAAITCMGYCKKQGIGITVQEILQSKSIKDLAAAVQEIHQPAVYQELVNVPFELSPIQKLHFTIRKEGQGYFNQSLRTRLNQQIDDGKIMHAIETIIKCHSMLRARLVECGSPRALRQCITPDVHTSYRWRVHIINDFTRIEHAISQSQKSINALEGPILAVDIFRRDDGDCILSMIAHHLVVDIVSWRIILEDLEDVLLNIEGNVNLTSSLPFQAWCQLQDDRSQTLISQNASLANDDISAPDFAYWGMEGVPILYGDATCESFEMSPEATHSILIDCHSSLQTEPIDIFLASLLYSFGQIFRDRSLPVIYNEGHGREVWDSTIDISRTVGWFTTLYPILLPDVIADCPIETVIRVKDLRRRVQDNGRQAFAHRMLMNEAQDRGQHHCPMEMSFNYVGQHRDLQRHDGLFQLMDQMAGETGRGGGASDFGEDAPRFALFEISALAVQGRLRFIFSFNKFMRHQDAIRNWIGLCCETLESMGKSLKSLIPKPTLSSFPMLSLTYDELENIVTRKLPSLGINSSDLIEDIYPCSRMQQGILLARSRDSSFYAVHGTYEVKKFGDKPDATKLIAAWRKVVSHHPILRTLFVENLTTRELFCQVVLKKFDPNPVLLTCSEDRDVRKTFDKQALVIYNERQPQHRFAICETATGKLFCRLELSHTVMDGVSISKIIKDLEVAYYRDLKDHKSTFKDYIGFLRGISQATSIEYWHRYLENAAPCLLPILNDGKFTSAKQLRAMPLKFDLSDELQRNCEKSGLTLSTAFSTAWGLMLRTFCGSNDISFCYMTSLRDLPIDDIGSIVGPIINLLPCRMRVSQNDLLRDVLHQVQRDYFDSLPHKSVSLTDIQTELKHLDSALLNTGISYRRISDSQMDSAGEIHFSKSGPIHDPAEFPLFVNIEASDTETNIELNYWTDFLSDGQADNIASVFFKYLVDIIHHQGQSLGQIGKLSDWNKRQIRIWNTKALEGVDKCVHDIVREKARSVPDMLAIDAWDQSFTYSELYNLSSRLATYLRRLGVGIQTRVPVKIGKSAWQIVAILAVLETGGICVPISEDYCEYDGHVALASRSQARSLEDNIPDVIVVDSCLFEYLPETEELNQIPRKSSDDGYVVMTTGSSSRPREVVLDHCTILSRAESFARTLNLNSATRTFQLAPYTSDVFLQELFGTFMCSGCVCIPENCAPNEVSTYINRLKANFINLTPSLAYLMHPSDVPEVKTVSLFGENLPKNLAHIWSEKFQLYTFYGATECSSTCIHNSNFDEIDSLPRLGSSLGCSTWLVDPADDGQLVPVGCTGELVIEGPEVSRNLSSHNQKIHHPFIEDHHWSSRYPDGIVSKPSRQVFKTGDLARYNCDGSLVYLGKKLEGINLKLQTAALETETQICDFLLPNFRCVVEVIDYCHGKNIGESLAVCLLPTTDTSIKLDSKHGVIAERSLKFMELAAKLNNYLLTVMPTSTVPRFYFPAQVTPITKLGKLNRQLLQDACRSFSKQDWGEFDIKHLKLKIGSWKGRRGDLDTSNPGIAYWKSHLNVMEPCLFPALSPQKEIASGVTFKTEHLTILSTNEIHNASRSCGVTADILLQVVWGLVLRCYTGLEEVCFGCSLFKQNGIDRNSTTRTSRIFPSRIYLGDEERLREVVHRKNLEINQMLRHQIPLNERQNVLGPETSLYFNTSFRYEGEWTNLEDSHHCSLTENEETNTCHIIVDADISGASGVIKFHYLSASLSQEDITNVADCFKHTLGSVLQLIQQDGEIRDVSFLGENSCGKLRIWNGKLPSLPNKCAHEIIREQALSRPLSAPAVCSWDGSLTYTELDLLSNKLAHNLIEKDVKPEVFVGLCFEKSIWAIVSQVAVLKAGGAFAFLDPTHPESRLSSLVTDINAPIVLCSAKYAAKAARICKATIVVSETTIAQMPILLTTMPPLTTNLGNAAYAIFTSGTTGKPKVTVIEHAALAIASSSFVRTLGMGPKTRALQFSSYTFDVSILETIIVLMTGGCICIPDDEERLNNLQGAIQRMKANFISGTPSVTSTLDPKSVPTLKTIVNGGEKMAERHITRWVDKCVINAYGPAEATIIATASLKADQKGVILDDDYSSVGTALCGRAWIVDPCNFNRLLPIGAVGELVLEGRNIARGYLNNDEKTKEVFIHKPYWCSYPGLEGILEHSERMYRTGDLVRYKSDGNICFISRKDTQVKINGQRIELEEIERHCLQLLPAGTQVAVDVVAPESKTVARGLATFFTVFEEKKNDPDPEYDLNDQILLSISGDMKERIRALYDSLNRDLPPVMIPKLFFPVRFLPLGSTGKLDRKLLRSIVEPLSKDLLQSYNILSSESTRAIEQGTESTLRLLWANILDLEPEFVNGDDSFFGLGGDSFSAMKLVKAASSQGISLTVSDIYQHPVLCDLSKRCEAVTVSLEQQIREKYSLLPTSVSLRNVLKEVSDLCCVPTELIDDIYPCSAVQEGLLTLSIKHQGAYIARPVFKLTANVDIEKFKSAWQQAVNEFEILRTRIVHTEAMGFTQVVLKKQPISWMSDKNIESLMKTTFDNNGGPLTQYAFVTSGSVPTWYFVWTIHHALYDGWSIPKVLKRVEEIYLGFPGRSSTLPYNLFIDYLQKRDLSQSDEFWTSYLSGLSCSQFPSNKNMASSSAQTWNNQYSSVNVPKVPGRNDITLAELIRAAWAIVVSAHTGCEDVCFGETLLGRNISMPGVTEVAGPVLTTVPMRIQVESGLLIADYLRGVRQLTAHMIPHQHTGLQRIRKINNEMALACEFQNLLVIQSANSELNKDIWVPENYKTSGDFFTHPLVIECKLSDYKVDVQAHHDENFLGSWQAERLVAQFSFILEQLFMIPKDSSTRVGDLDISSPLDKRDIAAWNQRQPMCVDRCVHDIIREKSLRQPHAPAICSWDGNLTYQELFETAASFALYLNSCGIGRETFVPVCMDKSLWVAITILGILIAGGGFVPLDPSHPTSRHKEILEEINANIIICSPYYISRYAGSVKTVIPMSKDTIKAYQITNPNPEHQDRYSTPSSMAYAIFTSGSTGRAKGIIVDHRALSSSAAAFGPIVHLSENSRSFQFASLTFDAAVLELLATLMHGGCVCIPNEDERLDDVAGAMRRMNVTWSFLTPSIASIIEPSSVPSLKVLVCGGEKLSGEVVAKWAQRVRLVNGYGPTETTIFAVLNTDFINHDFSCIGYGIPSTLTWVVDPENHNRLAPLGAVGELVLEGPALAREYLGNPKKTAEAFVEDTAWMAKLPHSLPQPRRIYKTGDLVRYNPDGSIECLGRKDCQVKLHGQRMELGEIEHRLHENHRIRHAVVILPQSGPLRQKLVTVLSLQTLSSDSKIISGGTCELVGHKEMTTIACPEINIIQKGLEEQLPSYMVPQIWAVVRKIPMLVSGKLDKKSVTSWVETLESSIYDRIMQDYDNIDEDDSRKEEGTRTSVNEVIRDVFAQVLNLPIHMVDPNRSFISLGGDSITGMAVVSKARKQGLKLTLPRVLQSKSIDELASVSGEKVQMEKQAKESRDLFDLSPIQKLFFRSNKNIPKDSGWFNQSITVRITRRVQPDVMESAIRAIVLKHSMLRARLNKSGDGMWRQKITNDVDSSYKFHNYSVKDSHEKLRKIAESQRSINVKNGPIFVADLFEFQDGLQALFLVASHLWVDMVSWRIILQDIQEFMDSGSIQLEAPLSFQTWSSFLRENSKESENPVLSPSNLPNIGYWGMKDLPNNYGHVKLKAFTLSEHTTKIIFQRCYELLRTEALEVLISAIIHSFCRVFTDRVAPTIYNEGHGRESWHPEIDPSRTVGWFTTLFPISVNGTADLFDILRRVKDTRRQVMKGSNLKFARSILNPSENQESEGFPMPLEILFNYLGQLQQLENDGSIFQHYGDVFNAKTFEIAGDMGPETLRFSLFEISAVVIKGRLHVSFAYNCNMAREEHIMTWISECRKVLEVDIPNLTNPPEPTLSDYPLLPITYNGLQNLVSYALPAAGIENWNDVEDIYPCSAVQEGILLSQLREPNQYIFNAIFEVHEPRGDRIDIPKLRQAWSAVVARHSILRTHFVDSYCKEGSFDQVVLKRSNTDVIEVKCDDSDVLSNLEAINLDRCNTRKSPKCNHQLTVCQTYTGQVLIKLEMNHAIIDGASVGILIRDLKLAYNNRLQPGLGPLFSEYIGYIKQQPRDDALAYWKERLAGVRPCHLPVAKEKANSRHLSSVMMTFNRFPEIQRFCEKHSFTLANVTLAAWSIVLHSYTGSNEVCFGYPSTGRDLPVPGIQEAVGIFINMLCCRVKFTGQQSVFDVSRAVQDNHIESLPHQNCSLAQIQHELGGKEEALFNTTISIQNNSVLNDEESGPFFRYKRAHDPTEYPMTVNVETARGREGILLRYWANSLSDGEAASLADAMAKVFTCYVEEPSRPISKLSLFGKPLVTNTRHKDSLEGVDGVPNCTSLERIIDKRIKEIIHQMFQEGSLYAPQSTDQQPILSHDLLPALDIRSSTTDKITTMQKSPSDSTQTLTNDLRAPSTGEKQLWKLWSTTLGLPLQPIKYNDSFFKLGGDSISAMKMVGAAREEGVMLSVADIFKNPIFEDMIAVLNDRDRILNPKTESESEGNTKVLDEPNAFSQTTSIPEISLLNTTKLDERSLREGICPNVGVFKGGIVDVLPATDFQSLSITATMFKSRWMLNYFYLDGKGPLDIRRLRESFLRVVDAFDILRTVFVCFHGQFFQVVLRKIRPDIFVHETDKNLDEHTKYLQQRDREKMPHQGEQFLQFYIVRKADSDEHRILLRLSHAQFDGVCLPKIMTAIKMGYEGNPIPPVSFSNYIRLQSGAITPEHYQYWRELLKGSRMTEIVQREAPNSFQHIGGYAEQKMTIEIPPTAIGNVTIATLMQSAWAITLAKLSAQADIVFGLTVSGRNATVPGVENTIGPCLNMIPVRVKFGAQWTGFDLFRYLQDQQVANMPYESLGFREIIRRCTDWPAATYFTTSVFHQNVDYEGQMQLDNNMYQIGGAGVVDNFTDLTLVSKPVSGNPHKISVSLGFSLKGPIHQAFVANALNMVRETIQNLVVNPHAALPAPSTLCTLPPQLIDPSSTSLSPNDSSPSASSSSSSASTPLFPLSPSLNNYNLSEILVHTKLLTEIWQQVLPPRNNGQPHTSFQLDSSFFRLGGDICNMAQVVWLLEKENLHVSLEDLLSHSTFFSQMVIIALQVTKQEALSDDSGPSPGTETLSPSAPPPLPLLQAKNEYWGALDKAKTLARKITRLRRLSTRA